MAWEPAYEVLLNEKLQDNLINLLKTNEAEALAYVNGGTAMPAIKQYAKARRVNAQYPFLAVLDSFVDPQEGEEYFRPETEFQIEIAVLGSDPDALSVTLKRYVRAVFLMIVSASATELLNGYSSKATAAWTVGKIQFSTALQSQIRQSEYLQIARMPVRFKLLER